MNLPPEVEAVWDEWQAKMDARAEQAESQTPDDTDAYFEREEDDREAVKSRVVTVDSAITALHIIAASVAFKGFPDILRRTLTKFIIFLNGFVSVLIAKKAAGKRPELVVVINVVREIIDAADSIYTSREIEKKIRAAAKAMRAQLIKRPLSSAHRERKTKLVSSREETPKQRKKNKSWRNPKA